MSVVKSKESFVFHSDLGVLITDVEEVEEYDVDDIAEERAVALSRDLMFTNIGESLNINSPLGPRSIRSKYYPDVEV
jgi:hypothetical protein